VDHYLLYFSHQLITHLLSVLLPFQDLFTESLHRNQLLAPPPFSGALTALHPFHCMFLFSSLFIIQFGFFFAGQGVSLSEGLCWFIPGMAVGTPCDSCCSPVGLLNVSQANLEPVSGGMGALLFSQCNVVWRSFPWARGSQCQSFDYS
jgi:hypothetical protein